MKKNISKVVSMVLTVFFLFSIIPMTPVFAATSGADGIPTFSENFENWGTNVGPFNLTNGKALYENSAWSVSISSKEANVSEVSVVNDGEDNALSLKLNAWEYTTETVDGTTTYKYGTESYTKAPNVYQHWIKTPVSLDASTDVATFSFKARRNNEYTDSFDIQADTSNLRIELVGGRVLQAGSSSNPGYLKTDNTIMQDGWNEFEFIFDYKNNIMDLYVNGVKMKPSDNVKGGAERSIPVTTMVPENPEELTFLGFSARAAYVAGTVTDNVTKFEEAEIQIDDISVRTYTAAEWQSLQDEIAAEAWAKVTDAVDARFSYLNGVKLDARVTSLSDALTNGSELDTVLTQAGATLEWASSKTNVSVAADDFGTVTHPAEDEASVDVTLTATVSDGVSATATKDYTVTVLPVNVDVYEDLETYLGEADYLANQSWTTTDENITVSVIPETESSSNNVINLRLAADADSSTYSMLKGLKCSAHGGGGGSESTEISFRLKRVNEAAKKINLHLESTNGKRLMAINFDLVTGAVTFPKVTIDNTAKEAVPAYPTGSSIFSPNIKELTVGEWVDIDILIPNLQDRFNKSVMIYVDGEPCLYANSASAVHHDNETIAVSKGQPMFAHPVDAEVWPNNNVYSMVFSVNPAENASASGSEQASFLFDDIMLGGCSRASAENICYKEIMNVLERKWNAYSATVESPIVINTNMTLNTEGSVAKSISWTSSVDGIVQNNKIVLPDAGDVTTTELTATVTSENASGGTVTLTRTWTVKVAPKLMGKVTDATVESGQLTSITMNNLCALPEGSKLLIGVYDSATSLYKNFKLVDVTDEDTVALDTPLAVGVNDTVKAFIWNMSGITPMAVSFSK